MKHLIKSVAIASSAFIILTLVVLVLSSLVFSPGKQQPSQALTSLIIFMYFLPVIISGYIGGRKAAKYGLLVGFFSCTVPLIIVGVLFPSIASSMDLTMVMIGILFSSLSGGVGEYYATRSKNA
jgi:hypothetical protein